LPLAETIFTTKADPMKTITYTRPSGSTIEVGDTKANVAHAEKMGWTRGEKKKARKPKSEKAAD